MLGQAGHCKCYQGQSTQAHHRMDLAREDQRHAQPIECST